MHLSCFLLLISVSTLFASGNSLSAPVDAYVGGVVRSVQQNDAGGQCFLRSHRRAEDEDVYNHTNDEERLKTWKLDQMLDDTSFAYKKFASWAKKKLSPGMIDEKIADGDKYDAILGSYWVYLNNAGLVL